MEYDYSNADRLGAMMLDCAVFYGKFSVKTHHPLYQMWNSEYAKAERRFFECLKTDLTDCAGRQHGAYPEGC